MNHKYSCIVGQKNSSTDEAFIQEVSMIHFLNQKFPMYFAQLYGYDLDSQTMLLKYYPEGSLLNYMVRGKNNKKQTVIFAIFQDISMALLAMHTEGIAHRDLKPENVLIEIRNNMVHAVLTDFGISAILEENLVKVKEFHVANAGGLSPLYCAPEVFEIARGKRNPNKENFIQSDIYSLACILYFCMNMRAPWM